MSLKIGENVVRVSHSLDPDETPSYSAFHPDPSCLHKCTLVVPAGLRVKDQGWPSDRETTFCEISVNIYVCTVNTFTSFIPLN